MSKFNALSLRLSGVPVEDKENSHLVQSPPTELAMTATRSRRSAP
jgi:hypothetical protein